MNRKILVYIAAPYTKGDIAQNVRRALECADILFAKGYIPYVPHLNAFWHFLSPKSWDDWMKIDLAILERCDAVFRLDGESLGANKEVRFADKIGLPIFYSIEELEEYYAPHR